MRPTRLFTALPLLATCAFANAQNGTASGIVAEATTGTAVYASPSSHARLFYRVKPYQRMVIRHSNNENWDKVLLQNRRFGYVPAADVAELPYVWSDKPRTRVATLSSRSGISSPGAGNAVTEYAMKYEGTPYEWGGNDLASGIDCSGFVKEVLSGTIGANLPRTAAEQALVGLPLTRLEQLRPGDRLYFRQKSDTKISHTGIYLGNGLFIHSSHGKGKVTTDSLLKSNWRGMLVAARR